MKIIAKAALIIATVLGGATPTVAANFHQNSRPIYIHTDASRPCTFFQLAGVAQADPTQPYVWFAIAHSHPRHAELFAILLTARASGVPVSVSTNGVETCGQAGVDAVWLG